MKARDDASCMSTVFKGEGSRYGSTWPCWIVLGLNTGALRYMLSQLSSGDALYMMRTASSLGPQI